MLGEEDLNPKGHRHKPGARVPSMMAPTLVLHEGQPELAVGSAGSNRIRSAILQTIINVVDPHVIVLGGGLSNITGLYDRVPALWGPYVFSDRVDTRLVRAKHGDASGVRGAAWLWPAVSESHVAGSDGTRVEGPAS